MIYVVIANVLLIIAIVLVAVVLIRRGTNTRKGPLAQRLQNSAPAEPRRHRG